MKKLLVAIVLFGALFSTSVGLAHGAENVNNGVDCEITINGVETNSVDDSSKPIVPSAGKDGNKDIYNVKVCGDLSTVAGQELVFSELSGTSWVSFDLTPVAGSSSYSCVEGQMKFDANGSGGFRFDVDTKARSGFLGANGRAPVCLREYATLVSGNPDDWEDYEQRSQDICESFTMSPRRKIDSTTVLTFTAEYDDSLWLDPTGGRWSHFISGGVQGDSGNMFVWNSTSSPKDPNLKDGTNTFKIGPLAPGSYTVGIYKKSQDTGGAGTEGYLCPVFGFNVGTPQNPGDSRIIDPTNKIGGNAGAPSFEETPFSLCAQVPEGTTRDKCDKCVGKEGKDGVWTAVGCVSQNAPEIVQYVVRTGLGLSGGVALIMILIAAFMFSTSQGEPKRVSEAREIMTSAIVGLLFVIFSVTILQFIGYNILRLPGFGG